MFMIDHDRVLVSLSDVRVHRLNTRRALGSRVKRKFAAQARNVFFQTGLLWRHCLDRGRDIEK